jgi:hypothetical protein
MAKFVKVDKVPENLGKDEYVVHAPTFVDEVKECYGRAPKTGTTTSNFMRDIAARVGDRYLDENYNTLIHVNTSRFRGQPFETPEDVDVIAKKMLRKSLPNIDDAYVDHHVKKRPHGTKLIYFLGDHTQTGAFTSNGIDEIKPKEIDTYLGKKQKKVVGKPIKSTSEN